MSVTVDYQRLKTFFCFVAHIRTYSLETYSKIKTTTSVDN